MAASSVLELVSTMLEYVDPRVPEFFRNKPTLAAKMLPAKDAIQVSRRLARLPFKTTQGGAFSKIVLNGGSLFHGTMFDTNNFTAGYITSSYAFQITDESIDSTENRKQAVINALADVVQNALKQQSIVDEISLFQDGTGILTNPSSGSAANSLTFADATDGVGVSRLIEGMCVDVWNEAGDTKRAPATGAPLIIAAIDYATNTVTFNQNVTSIATTDIIAFQNLDIYGPSTLTSFSSAWPQQGLAGGLGGDSFRHGIYYANDADPSNYYLGILRSTLPQILPSSVNAATGALTFQHGQLIKDKLSRRRGDDIVEGLMGIAEYAQRSQVWQLGLAISNKFINGDKFGKITDLGFEQSQMFDFCDMPCYTSSLQDRSRFDFTHPKMWCRVQLNEPHFKKNGNQLWFEGRGSDGTVQTFKECFIIATHDFVDRDPGGDGYVYGLTTPAGWESN